MRFVYFLLAVELIVLSGCGSKQATIQSVHGKPLEYWLSELKRPEPKARIAAVKACKRVGDTDPAAVPAIASALNDKDAKVRDAAALAILNIGPAARGAVEALTNAKGDKDATVRKHVEEALQHITPGK